MKKINIKELIKKYKISKMVNKNNPLYRIELHALYYHLRNRKNITMGRYTYGTPIVRTGGIAELKIGKFYCIGPDVSIHMVSDHHVDWATTYDLMALMD